MPSPLPNPPLFPPWVAQHTVTFDAADPTDLATQFPGIDLPGALDVAVRRRQLEFLAGRFCARQALLLCAPEHADAAIGVGPNREPLWPAGIVGAITHTHGYASVAVARASQARAIGLDAERLMDAQQAAEILPQLAEPVEVDAVARATGWSTATALTAIFSAKESLFKALYGQVGRYFNFRDAWVEAFDTREETFRARLVTPLTPTLPAGYALGGRFVLESFAEPDSVCTAIVLGA